MTQYRRPAQRRPGASPAARPAQTRRPAPPRAAAPRPQQRRPAPSAAPRSAPGGFLSDYIPQGFWLLALAGLAIILGSVLLTYLMPNGFQLRADKSHEVPHAQAVSEIHSDGPLRLNEIMTSNGGVLVDGDGNTPDWVEVANIGNRPVNLEGWVLARSAKAGNVFVFPSMELEAGGCLLVYADSQLRAEAGEELHAPFRLSSGGDVLMLFNAAEVAVDTVNIPALASNTAYARKDRNTWTIEEQSTPGAMNTAESYAAMTTVSADSEVRMAEIVASNTRYGADENGVFQDYVVLENTSGADADISGWFLSDDPAVTRKWRFPNGTVIPGGGTLLVHCSGLNRMGDPAHLHTNFRLSSEGETVTLSNAGGQSVDQASYDLLKTDTAYLRGDGGWTVGTPTR